MLNTHFWVSRQSVGISSDHWADTALQGTEAEGHGRLDDFFPNQANLRFARRWDGIRLLSDLAGQCHFSVHEKAICFQLRLLSAVHYRTERSANGVFPDTWAFVTTDGAKQWHLLRVGPL